jgi:hypothetical protein
MKPDNQPKKKCDRLIKSKPNEGLMRDKETEMQIAERVAIALGAVLGTTLGAIGVVGAVEGTIGAIQGVAGAIGVALGSAVAVSAGGELIKLYFSKKAKTIPVFNKETTKALPPSNTPPKTAEYLLYLIVPRKNRDALLGDLQEDFNEVQAKFGLKHAKIHYWVQTLRSIPPLLTASLIGSVVKYFKSTT